jgi:membrane protease YdiL (CAAX protease family)
MNAIAGSHSTLQMMAPGPATVGLSMTPAEPDAPLATTAPAKPRLWSVFAAWFAALVVGNVAMGLVLGTAIVITALAVAQPDDDFATTIMPKVQAVLSHPVLALLVTLVPYQLGMLAVVALAVRLSKERASERTGLLPPSGCKVGAVRLTLLAGFTASTAYAVALLFTAMFGAAPAAANVEAQTWSWWTIPLFGLILTAVPAIIEEIFFRGYIQRRLLQRWSPTVAIAVSTTLFAIVHMDSLQHIVAVVPLGAVLGLLAYQTNSIKPGMIVHAIHNAGVVAFGWAAGALGSLMSAENLGLLVAGTLSLTVLVGLPAAISLMRKAKSESDDLSRVPSQELSSALAMQAA